MTYPPNENELARVFEITKSFQREYREASQLLENRIKELDRLGEINVKPFVAYIIYNRAKAKENVIYKLIITSIRGIKETVESSNDVLVNDLYKKASLLVDLIREETTKSDNFLKLRKQFF